MELTRSEMEILALEDLLYHVDPGRRWDAIREFVGRCPRKVLEGILWGDSALFVYGPHPAVDAELVATFESRAMLLKGSAVPIGKNIHVLYLAPSLEGMPEGYVLGVVAREIAHAWLKHLSPEGHSSKVVEMIRSPDDKEFTLHAYEPDADRLAHEWGFAEEVAEANRKTRRRAASAQGR